MVSFSNANHKNIRQRQKMYLTQVLDWSGVGELIDAESL